MFPNARDATFPGIYGEKSGSRKMAFGNADLYPEADEIPLCRLAKLLFLVINPPIINFSFYLMLETFSFFA